MFSLSKFSGLPDTAVMHRYPETRYLETRYPENLYAETRYPENLYPETRYPENRYFGSDLLGTERASKRMELSNNIPSSNKF